MQVYRGRMAAAICAVLAVFATASATGVVGAPGASAQGNGCSKAAADDGVRISAHGFEDGASAAIRRNGKWAATEDAAGLDWTGAGSVDDDWKLRVRGPGLPTPYLEIECTSAPVDVGASCTVVDVAGALRIELDGFAAADRLNLRRDGRWAATLTGDVRVVDDLAGDVGDAWTVRARGAAFADPYSTIECVGQVIDPPPDDAAFCRVTDAGLEWDDAGADVYQVRRNGRWITGTTERTYATDDLDADWVIRYSIGFGKVEEPCGDGVPVDGPCILQGQLVVSIMNGAQCAFAQELFDPNGGFIAGNVFDPCLTDVFFCDEGRVSGITTGDRRLPATGLRWFPDLTFLDLRNADVPSLPAEVAELSKLEVLLAGGSNLSELPREIGELDSLIYLDVGRTEITSLPPEIADMASLREMSAYANPGLTTIPAELYAGPSVELIDLGESGITEMPLADVVSPTLDRIGLTRTPLAGDQTAWLTSLGPAFDLAVRFETGPPCAVWTTDAEWDAWLEQLEPTWAACEPPVDPEPPQPPVEIDCRLIPAGLEWDDAGADGGEYHVRRDGKWVDVTTDRYFLADPEDGAWTVRYRVAGERTEVPCDAFDPGPCMIGGVEVESVMTGPQCEFAEALAPHLEADPCAWNLFGCRDGEVVVLAPESGPLPDGLRHFPNLEVLSLGFGDYGNLPEELGALVELERLEIVEATVDSLPSSIGRLDKVEVLNFEFSTISGVPAELGDMASVHTVQLGFSPMSEIPAPVFRLPSLRNLDVSFSSVESIPDAIGQADSLLVLTGDGAAISTVSTEVFAIDSLRNLHLFDTPIAEMPIAENGAPNGLIIDVMGTQLTGDQTDWLVALGNPIERNLTVYFSTEEPCPVWTADAVWDVALLAVNEWQNCQPPA